MVQRYLKIKEIQHHYFMMKSYLSKRPKERPFHQDYSWTPEFQEIIPSQAQQLYCLNQVCWRSVGVSCGNHNKISHRQPWGRKTQAHVIVWKSSPNLPDTKKNPEIEKSNCRKSNETGKVWPCKNRAKVCPTLLTFMSALASCPQLLIYRIKQ